MEGPFAAPAPMELSRGDERRLRRLSTRKGREREGLVLVEGPRAVETALDAGVRFRLAVIPAGSEPALAERLRAARVEMKRADASFWTELTGTETPQSLVGVVEEPRPELPLPGEARAERVLVLDRVQDPGNLGALVRSAAALGVDRVLVLDGSVDPWNSKAVRAAAGTGFLLPLHLAGWERVGPWLRDAGLPLLVAEGGGEPVGGPLPAGGWALAVGNEGTGPRPELLAAAARSLAVPMARGVESLNVGAAGTLLMWELMRSAGHPPSKEPHP